MPAVMKAQTTKQAKAAYKARGRPTLSEKEQRQLNRAVQLEQRAQRTREAGQRRAEVAKKRANRESRDNAKHESTRMGSQRRCDRFGFKASQFHLGAFFGQANHGPAQQQQSDTVIEEGEAEDGHKHEHEEEGEDDLFEDDGLDDKVLLEALGQPVSSTGPHEEASDGRSSCTTLMLPPPLPGTFPRRQRAQRVQPVVSQDDLDCFWHELDSSTQIARELSVAKPFDNTDHESRSASFSSTEFDLTAEDLDELDPPCQKQSNATTTLGIRKPLLPLPMSSGNASEAGLSRMPPNSAHDSGISIPGPYRYTRKATTPVKRVQWQSMFPPNVPTKWLDAIELDGGSANVSNDRNVQMSPDAPSSIKRVPLAMAPPPPPVVDHELRSGAYGHEAGALPTPGVMQAKTEISAKTPAKHVVQRHPFHQQFTNKPPAPKSVQSKPPKAIRGPFLPASSLYCSPEFGFTLSQLEHFVEDDIQLTQVVSGCRRGSKP